MPSRWSAPFTRWRRRSRRTGRYPIFAAHPVRRAGHCGKGGDYLARYDVPAREATDVRWAQVCMELEDTVERLDALFEPVFARRMQKKLWQALYYRYDFAKEYRPSWKKICSGWTVS